MGRFFEGADRSQATIPECLDDWIDEENPVRVIDAFVDAVDLRELGFDGLVPEATGRPSYHPSVLLKLYIYGYLNRVQSGRRLEREVGRNVEVMWLTGRLPERGRSREPPLLDPLPPFQIFVASPQSGPEQPHAQAA
jgi:transposase